MPQWHTPTCGWLFNPVAQDAFVYVRAQIEEQFSAFLSAMFHGELQQAARAADVSQQSWFGRNELPDLGQVSQRNRCAHRQHCAVLQQQTRHAGEPFRALILWMCPQGSMIERRELRWVLLVHIRPP